MHHSAKNTIPLVEFKTHASAILNEINDSGAPYVITQNGKASAVVVSAASWDLVNKRIEVLEDLARAAADIAAGKTVTSDEIRGHFADRYASATGQRSAV